MPTATTSSAPGVPPISPHLRDQERDHSADESWSGRESDNAAHNDDSPALKRKRPLTVSYVILHFMNWLPAVPFPESCSVEHPEYRKTD